MMQTTSNVQPEILIVAKSKVADVEVASNRRDKSDRRKDNDRRAKNVPVAAERREGARRDKVSRRRQIDPTTYERDYSDDEVEFMNALNDYKRTSGRMFPTCSEILEVNRKLEYEKKIVPMIEAVEIPAEPN